MIQKILKQTTDSTGHLRNNTQEVQWIQMVVVQDQHPMIESPMEDPLGFLGFFFCNQRIHGYCKIYFLRLMSLLVY